MVIRAHDRLSEVLARDSRMVEIITTAAPTLRGLRNPITRRVMGRLATMEQVARIAGLEPDLLLHRINRAMGEPLTIEDRHAESPQDTAGERETPAPDMPAFLANLPAERISDLDVREDLRQGREPFSRIMSARAQLRSGGVLRLRATFEPAPLYVVMGKQGYGHWTEQLANDDWRVWFYKQGAEETAGEESSTEQTSATDQQKNPATNDASDETADVIIVDVRGLEPPEPMVRTLAALERLPQGKTLLQINERVPQFLLPRLEELGLEYDIREQAEGVVRVFIRRP